MRAKTILTPLLLTLPMLLAAAPPPKPAAPAVDRRDIRTGWEIPTLTYSDQPYIVKTDDGAWLCAVTTGAGHEGQPGQIVVTMRSTDKGRTWSKPVEVEPPTGPEASYAVLLKLPTGRIYVFYNHNTDNLREARADDPPFKGGKCKRVDSLGYFVFKFSDDGGKSWSAKRHPIPMRLMDIDRKNPYGGKVLYFWNVGKPFLDGGAAYVSLHKVGGLGDGFFTRSEGVLLKSTNLLTERDPEKITWETLPEGDFGLRTPPGGGPVAEEQSYAVLSDGSFYCVYRTIDGHPACAYSRDAGRHWTTPEYQAYADGRPMKHSRAANFIWKCENGKYLYWFHNHGGRFIREHPRRATMAYEDRNPVWLCGGVEDDTPSGKVIRWSQPEIVLYDDDPYIRMSYPDLVEDGGKYYLTETQKDVARVHEVDRRLLEGLWNQLTNAKPAKDGILVALGGPMPKIHPLPALPEFNQRDMKRADYGTKDLRRGFSLDLWLQLDSLAPGQIVLDNRTPEGKGFSLQTTARGSLELVLNDGRSDSRWDCDPGLLKPGKLHHVAAIVDGGPKIITFVVDGRLCDGGDFRQFGWGRFNPNYRGPTGDVALRIAPRLKGEVKSLRLYGRALRTSEALGNFRAGCPKATAQSQRPSFTIPLVDLDDRHERQVVVDREAGQYLGHPTTVLLEDGKTMLCVYPKGHGRGAIIYKRSPDGGLTWSERLPTPASWATSLEVPTLHRVIDPAGTKRIIMFSGLYPCRMAVTEDDGLNWSELKPVGDWGGIVTMGSVVELRTGRGHYMALFHDDGRFFTASGKTTPTMTLYKTFSRDGGLTWSPPETIYASDEVHLCEPGAVRSPDGRNLAVLLRENRRVKNSHVMFSDDEGRTWTAPRALPGALCGDRHTGKYGPDGRLFISFRDVPAAGSFSPTAGDWVGWVGRYEDIAGLREGQYRVRLKGNHRGADCAYPGVEVLPDGTFVSTTYGHWQQGQSPYILSVRFKLDELDALAKK